jgi:hypothetical protein
MRCKKVDEKLIIKHDLSLCIVSVFLVLLSSFVFVLVSTDGFEQSIRQPQDYDEWKLFIFSIFLFLTGIFLLIFYSGYKIVIDFNGVREQRLIPIIPNRFYGWNEINKWGISYAFTQSKSKTTFYMLFFSAERRDKKNGGRVKKGTVKINFRKEQLNGDAVKDTVRFCECYAKTPFLENP